MRREVQRRSSAQAGRGWAVTNARFKGLTDLARDMAVLIMAIENNSLQSKVS
jgi:hypothetical protein